jgi:hypothetical protein
MHPTKAAAFERIANMKRETRARLRTRLEAEAQKNFDAGKVWIWGEWAPREQADKINARLRARGWVIFLETLVALGLLLLAALVFWIAFCVFLTPYPINPRGPFGGVTQQAK